MELKLSSEVLKGLPAPDAQSLVRVSVALRVKEGKAEVVEINDVPVGSDRDMEELDSAVNSAPSPQSMEAGLYPQR